MAKIVGVIKLLVPAGNAAGGQGIGPALGQKGISIKAFSDVFNKMTEKITKGTVLPTKVFITDDKKNPFSVTINTKAASQRIKEILGLEKGGGSKETVATISMDQVRTIAQEKIVDSYSLDVEKVCRSIIGTAKSMGIVLKQ